MTAKDLALKILIGIKDNTAPGSRSIRAGLKSISDQLGALQRGAVGFIGVWQGFNAGKNLLDTAIAFQRVDAQLKNIFGSAQAAAREYAFVAEQSDKLGTSTLSAAQGFAKLAASAQIQGLTLEQTRQLYSGLSQAISGLQLSGAEAERVFLAFTQILAKPKVSLEEINGQLADVIPGAAALADKSLGSLAGQFQDLASKGKILSREFALPFAQTLANQFPAATDTAQAALNRLENAWNDVKRSFAESGFVSALADTFKSLAATLKDPGLKSSLREWGDITGQTIRLIVDNAGTLLKVAGALAGMRLGAGLGRLAGPQGALAGGALGALGGFIGAGSALPGRKPPGFSPAEDLPGLSTQYADLLRRIGELKKANAANPMRPFTDELARTEKQAKEVIARIGELTAASKNEQKAPAVFDPAKGIAAGNEKPTKAGKTKEASLNDARELAQARLDLQRDANVLALEEQQSGIEAQERALDRQLDSNLIDYKTYYSQLAQLRQADLDAQIAQKRREIELAQQSLANLPQDQGRAAIERAGIEGDIARRMSEIGRLEAQKGEIVAEFQADVAAKDRDMADQLDQFRLKLLELQASGISIADAVIPPEQQALFAARLKTIENQYRDTIAQLRATGDTSGVDLVNRVIRGEALQGLKTQAEDADSAFKDLGLTMTSAFEQAVIGGESLQDVLRGLLKDIQQITLRQLFTKPLTEFLDGLGKGGAGGGKSGGGFMDFLYGIGNFFGAFFHAGGIAGGAPTFYRPVSPLVFAGAPRYHGGGLAGIRPDEVPAILKRGEEILPQSDPRHRNNAGSGGVRIINTIDPNLVHDYLSSSQGEKVIVNHIQRNAGAIRQILR
jgi:tape measure domain-containing protein